MACVITESCIGCTACVRVCPVNAISGEKKEVHSIDRELCIDCLACGRICPKGAVLDSEGNQVEKLLKKDWPKPVFDYKKCIRCTACVVKCPVHCLEMELSPKNLQQEDKPIMVRPDDCVWCSWCATFCPTDAIEFVFPKKGDK